MPSNQKPVWYEYGFVFPAVVDSRSAKIGGGSDLFSEIHLSEIQKFEELLAAKEEERESLEAQFTQSTQRIAGECDATEPIRP